MPTQSFLIQSGKVSDKMAWILTAIMRITKQYPRLLQIIGCYLSNLLMIRVWQGVLSVAVLLITLTIIPDPSWAMEFLGSQPVNQPATLVGPQARAPIPIYLRPAPNQQSVGYGIHGDPITVLEQLASFLPEADESTAWNHIRLEHEPYTEGWIQGKFLVISDTELSLENR